MQPNVLRYFKSYVRLGNSLCKCLQFCLIFDSNPQGNDNVFYVLHCNSYPYFAPYTVKWVVYSAPHYT